MPEIYEDPEAEFCRSMGYFLLEFSQLEATIRMRLAGAIGLEEKYNDAVLSAFDFAKLCATTEFVLVDHYGDNKAEIHDIFSECKKLNDERVRVAHGLITHDQDGENFSARAIARSSGKADHHFLNGELIKHADTAQKLLQKVLYIANKKLAQTEATPGTITRFMRDE